MRSKKLIGSIIGTFLIMFGSNAAPAQTTASQYVISAKAGGINSAVGDVKVRRRGTTEFDRLAPQDSLADGDTVSTGANGRVEVLLNPGGYFRAAENTEFELENSSLDNLSVKLNTGGAIIEATNADGANLFVEIKTPETTVSINKRGIYRVNVLPSRQTTVFVREGDALVGNIKVKEGRTLTVGSSGASESAIAKFNKKERDNFDLWSESRAETLVAVNKRLTRNTINNSYSSYQRGGFGFRSNYRGSGLWLYDASFGGHTFLPFYNGLSSPYGHGYKHGFGFSSRSGFWGGNSGGFRTSAPRPNINRIPTTRQNVPRPNINRVPTTIRPSVPHNRTHTPTRPSGNRPRGH